MVRGDCRVSRLPKPVRLQIDFGLTGIRDSRQHTGMTEYNETLHPRSADGKFAEKSVDEVGGGLTALQVPNFDPDVARELTVDQLMAHAEVTVEALQGGDTSTAAYHNGVTSVLRSLADKLDAEDHQSLAADYAERLHLTCIQEEDDTVGPGEGWFGDGRQRGFAEALALVSMRPTDGRQEVQSCWMTILRAARYGASPEELQNLAAGR